MSENAKGEEEGEERSQRIGPSRLLSTLRMKALGNWDARMVLPVPGSPIRRMEEEIPGLVLVDIFISMAVSFDVEFSKVKGFD